MEQPLRDHGLYMKRLYDDGILMYGGPFMNDRGGMSVIRVENEEAARRIVDADPAVTEKIMVAELHPWYMVDWDKFGT